MNFEKYYLLDTNILLEDARNIFKLSDGAKNLIILSETVLDELDSKKSGYDEINFQAREFARILENAIVVESIRKDLYKIIRLKKLNSNGLLKNWVPLYKEKIIIKIDFLEHLIL